MGSVKAVRSFGPIKVSVLQFQRSLGQLKKSYSEKANIHTLLISLSAPLSKVKAYLEAASVTASAEP